jgi:hypothetical protein
MQLNIGHFSKSMLEANYLIIMVLPDALGTWAALKAECGPIRLDVQAAQYWVFYFPRHCSEFIFLEKVKQHC